MIAAESGVEAQRAEDQEGYKLIKIPEVMIRASHGFMGEDMRCCGPRTTSRCLARNPRPLAIE
jgi:hypothetical protein